MYLFDTNILSEVMKMKKYIPFNMVYIVSFINATGRPAEAPISLGFPEAP